MSQGSGVEAFIRRYRALPEGYYREFAPTPDLKDFIACGWISAIAETQVDSLMPIIPDGCADIMTYNDGAPFVVGPDAVTRWVPLPGGLVITGLRLRPGAAQTILGCAASELLGQSAELSDFAPDSLALHHSLERLHAPGARLAQLEHWVRARLERNAARDLAVVSACRAIARSPELAMDSVADLLGWNARMLHRKFVAACGYGPKHLQRILRVQGVIRAAQPDSRAARLSEVAAALGFTDQAHLTRDFRSITGFTPGAYLARANAEVGRWLDETWTEAL